MPHARLVFRNKTSLEQTHLYMGVPAYPFPHELRFACYTLNTILGGGMSSRLFQNIREKQGLAYAVYSELTMYRDTGCMAIYAGTSVETGGKVIDSIVKEFRELKENLVPAEELRRAKDHLKGSFMLGLESTSSRMGNLARQELYFKRFFTLDEMLESIEAVTAEQVQRDRTGVLRSQEHHARDARQPRRLPDQTRGSRLLKPPCGQTDASLAGSLHP